MADQTRVAEFSVLFLDALAKIDDRAAEQALNGVRKILDQFDGFDGAAISICVAGNAIGHVVNRIEIEDEGDCRAETLDALVEVVRDSVQAMAGLPRRWPTFGKDVRNYKALFQHFAHQLPRVEFDRALEGATSGRGSSARNNTPSRTSAPAGGVRLMIFPSGNK